MFRLAVAMLMMGALASSAQDKNSAGEPQKVDTKIMHPPVPLKTPAAEFPEEAHRLGRTSGVCDVSVVVDLEGKPQNPQVIRCSDAVFAANSLAAVRQFRFKPAIRLSDGKPVAVVITINMNFRSFGGPPPRVPIGVAFLTPPHLTTLAPDANGVYPLTKSLEPPKIKRFNRGRFSVALNAFPVGTTCEVILDIDAKGRASDAQIAQCDTPGLAGPAVESLLHSKYESAKLNGKAVPVRTMIRLKCADIGPEQK